VRLEPSRPAPSSRDPSSRDVAWQRHFAVGLLGLVILAAALRFTRLGAQSIWIDECMTIGWIDEVAQRGWGSMLQNIHGPLHASCVVLVGAISTSEWWLRLPSALAGSLAVATLGLLGRRFWSPSVGLTAAALMAISPFALYYAQEVRNYAFTLLFTPLTILAGWSLAERPSGRRTLLFVAAEIASVLSNLNGLFLALGLNLWLLGALRHRRRALLVWLATHLVIVVALAPYALHVQRQVRPERLVGVATPGFGQEEPLRGGTTLHPFALPYTAYAFASGYSLGPTLEELRASPRVAAAPRHLPGLLLVAVGFGIPFAAGVLRRRDAAPGVPMLFATLVVIGFTLWLAAMNLKPFNVRYLSVLQPIFLLMVARGLWSLPRSAALVCAAAIVGASAWSCYNYLAVPRYARDDVRGAVQLIREHGGPTDLVVHINLITPLRYYGIRERVMPTPVGIGASREAATAFAAELGSSGPTTIWYVECRPEGPDPHGYIRSALVERASRLRLWELTGVRLYQLQLRT
jgi:hypothetical protein